MDLGISGKTALVTASSKGLGKGAALALAAEGARVVICARGERDLLATATEIERAGGEVRAIVADVADPDTPQRLVTEAISAFGSLDILVANAGGPPPSRALDLDDEAISAAIEVNLLASIRLVRVAVAPMRAAGWGRICLITSTSIKEPIPGLSLSNTARTGLWAWAKTAARDLFEEGITLNSACPGAHATERLLSLGHPSGPTGDPADFGRIVAFLCSEPAGFISGAALSVDGARSSGLF